MGKVEIGIYFCVTADILKKFYRNVSGVVLYQPYEFWMYRVIQNQTAAAYLFLYFSIFLSLQFSNIKSFVTLLSGIVSHRKLKLGIDINNGVDVSCIPKSTAAAYLSLFSFFFLSNFQRLKFFITLFSGTVRSRYWKLVTHVDCERMYHVYHCCCLFIPLFLHLSFSPFFNHLNFS